MHADGSGLRQLTAMPGQEWVPSWSPDGLRIAFVSKTPRDQQIFSVNADGSDLRQLTHSFAPTYGPDWSPDGTRIVYNSNASGTDQLYIMQADGTNPKQITSQGENNWGAAWSPDGNWIAFNSVRGSDPDLFLVHPDGSGEQRLTVDPGRKTTPTWSSDGRQIAFSFDRDGQYDIKVINADGTNIGNLTHNHALEFVFPKWSPDGTQIMVTASGHPTLADAFQLQDLGVAGILIQSALLIGAVLMLIGSWRLPIGALTVLFTVNGLLMATLTDRYLLIIPMFLAGLVADALLMWLKPSAARRRAYIFFAAAVPVTLYGLYFLTLQLTQGMSWGIHLWLGALVIAGLGGWLVGFLFMWAGSIARATASQ
jgi:Tol biopolymer transport system component